MHRYANIDGNGKMEEGWMQTVDCRQRMITLILQALQTNWYVSKYRMHANYSVKRKCTPKHVLHTTHITWIAKWKTS